MKKKLIKLFVIFPILGSTFLSFGGCGQSATTNTADATTSNYPTVSVKCGTSSCIH